MNALEVFKERLDDFCWADVFLLGRCFETIQRNLKLLLQEKGLRPILNTGHSIIKPKTTADKQHHDPEVSTTELKKNLLDLLQFVSPMFLLDQISHLIFSAFQIMEVMVSPEDEKPVMQVPRGMRPRVVLCSSLPLTASGKVG